MKYIKRNIEDKLNKLFKTYKVVLITGARQVGKTRLITEMFKDYKYINLDDYQMLVLAKNDGKLFLQRYGSPLILDEVQRAPSLFRTIKLFVDKDDEYGKYILSGSQLFKLMDEASDSLAGRVAILELQTLSLREINNDNFNEKFLPTMEYIKNREKHLSNKTFDIWDHIFNGMYPELQNKDKDREEFYRNYIKTYIERDIREITNVQNLDLFYKFMVCVASRTGQLINYSNIASEVGVDADTIKKWISILETSNIVYIIRPFYNKELKRVLKTPKLYFRDTGLCAFLTRWLTRETLENGAMNGAIFETFVVSEIIKSYTNLGYDYNKFISFYNGYDNTKGTQSEIDLILEMDGTIYPVEIKMNTNPGLDSIENFNLLKKIKDRKIGEGAVICLSDSVGFINEKVNIIPSIYL